MTMQRTSPSSFVLPLPRFVLRPYTAVFIAVIHIYLCYGHLSKLYGGEIQWTHFWKGFGSLAGAYVFAALASRGFARHQVSPLFKEAYLTRRTADYSRSTVSKRKVWSDTQPVERPSFHEKLEKGDD
jgi:hypothetical protein